MNSFLQIVKLIPALIELISSIEKSFPQSGQGAAKTAAVKGIMEATYEGINEMWPVVEKVVAALVSLFNTTGTFVKK